MAKQNKYAYWRVLQQNGGYGWDDIEHFNLADSAIAERKQCLKEYRENMPSYRYRWVDRRELNK